LCENTVKKGAGIYCSFVCEGKHRTQKVLVTLESDGVVGNIFLRKYLMKINDNKCQECGWGVPNPVLNKVCLDLHHIDGDSKNTRLSNVQLLCPNCHSLTPTYKRVGGKHKSTRIR